MSCPKCNWINSYAKRATNLFHNLFCNVFRFSIHFILFVYNLPLHMHILICASFSWGFPHFCSSHVLFVVCRVCVTNIFFVQYLWAFRIGVLELILVLFLFLSLSLFILHCLRSYSMKSTIHNEYRAPAMEPLSLYLFLSHTFGTPHTALHNSKIIVNYGYAAVFHIFVQWNVWFGLILHDHNQ